MKDESKEPIAKLWVDERQSHFESIFGIGRAAWWFHGAKFKLGNGPKWGSRSPLTSFAIGSKANKTESNRREEGFTLLEIMVVMVIIGVLAALIAPRFLERADEAKVEASKVQMKNIGQALKLYRLQNGKYPPSGSGLNALVSADKKGKRYMDSVPRDAWGNAFVYLAPGVHGDFDLLSYGGDGQSGGSGFDADIGNWE